MKGGKDNGSVMDPLFPRLHIDDADKGGPRPPPRNKMSVPASNDRGCVVPRASPSNIGTQQKLVFRDAEKPDFMYREKSSFLEESKNITYDMSRLPERNMRKRCYSEIDDSSRYFPLDEDKNKMNKNETIKECYDDESRKHICDTSGDSFEGLVDLTSEDVVGAIGQTLFLKARTIIVQQQKLFAVQIFELHRLIKVQTLISQKNSNLKKPCIKFPPINKLLYITPLEQSSPLVIKPKLNNLKSNPAQHQDTYAVSRQLASPKVEKRHVSQQLIPKHLLVHSCPANQWLVHSSPSEGLVYKPMMGHCLPAVGVVAQIYGNYGPIHLSPIDVHTAYGFPAHALSRSYLQPYAVPMLNGSCRRLDDAQQDGVMSKYEENTENSPRSKLREELSLFPTTPSIEGPRCDEQRVQAIKVVPRNARSAAESTAWTFRSIQKERKTCIHNLVLNLRDVARAFVANLILLSAVFAPALFRHELQHVRLTVSGGPDS